jgi:excisionase family DNA binding protein
MGEENESVLTIDELAEYLKISKSTLYKLVQEGKVPGQKVGRHWRFSRRAIDRWIEREDDEKGRSGAGDK